MVLTRRSGGAAEDANALILRSRTIDVESRHSNKSCESPRHETPRKRRKIGASPIDNAGEEANGNSPKPEEAVTVPRPKDTVEESLSPPIYALPTARPLVKEDAVKAGPLSNHQTTPGPVVRSQGAHKRFESEEHGTVAGGDPNIVPSVAQNDLTNAQGKATNVPNDASDDESAPETFTVKLKQRLPFPVAPKEQRPRRLKPRNSAPVDASHNEPAPVLAAPSGSIDGVPEDQLSSHPSHPAEKISTSKKHTNAKHPSSGKVKDLIKNGVTYRTVSAESPRGQTSPWLPAKAMLASKELKEKLLVRKRVQKVCNGRRPKFVTSG